MKGPSLERIAVMVCQTEDLAFDRLVGEGAFKRTFRVTDSEGNALALKVHRPKLTTQRTDREIEAMQLCTHDSIGRLHAVRHIEVDDERYVITLEEYLPGGTLSALLEDAGPISNDTLNALALPLVSAVGHIAGHSLVHRDIKPANILFRADGQTPVLVDFGLVRALERSSLTQTWNLRGPGTPFFAAPEQLQNEKDLIDWRTDQFSLGVTLFLSTYGFHPYGAPNSLPPDVVDQVATRLGVSDVAQERMIGDGYEVLLTMVQPWPVQRYRTPRELQVAWSG